MQFLTIERALKLIKNQRRLNLTAESLEALLGLKIQGRKTLKTTKRNIESQTMTNENLKKKNKEEIN